MPGDVAYLSRLNFTAMYEVSISRMICPSLQLAGEKKMSDRKYRQSGYMESDREPQRPKPQTGPRSAPRDREGPRSPKMMAFGETVKCAACAAKAPTMILRDSTCPKCNADLHTCRQCTYFDPSARFECIKSIPARIVNKNARNTCELFAARTVVERETSSGPPKDARQAFANLFKK
jgi:hypothetical protein